MTHSETLLELRHVSRRYPVREGFLSARLSHVHAVEDVSFAVHKGETLGLVGESGCGKSTLARLILVLEKPDEGDILFEATSLAYPAPQDFRRKVQMIFQDPYSSLNPRLNIGASIRESLVAQKIGDKPSRKERVQELVRLVGLRPEHVRRYPHEFSGGQRQRAAIARALAPSPDLIVCDEPVSALDVSIQAQILNLLENLQADFGLTYIFISHDLSVVSSLCDRVAVMYLGRIVELSPKTDLYDNPLHPYTQALLSAVPIPDPEQRKAHTKLSGDLPSPMNPPSGCPFHPRCPEAMEVCSSVLPKETEPRSGHMVRCHLYPQD